MTTTPEHAIAIARSQLGIAESPRNSNRVKYSIEYRLIGPWCAMFLWWVFREAGAGDLRKTLTPLMASCQGIHDALRQRGLLRRNKRDGQPGDVVLFEFDGDPADDHIGLLIRTTVNGVWTIDGNTSATSKGSQSNGGIVAERFRLWSQVSAVGTFPGVKAGPAPQVNKPTPPKEPEVAAPKTDLLVRDEESKALIYFYGQRYRNVTALRDVYTFLGIEPDEEWPSDKITEWIETMKLVRDKSA